MKTPQGRLRSNSHIVVPAKAGTQATQALLDPRLRGDDILLAQILQRRAHAHPCTQHNLAARAAGRVAARLAARVAQSRQRRRVPAWPAAAVLRSLALAAIVAALARPVLHRTSDEVSVVYALDVSSQRLAALSGRGAGLDRAGQRSTTGRRSRASWCSPMTPSWSSRSTRRGPSALAAGDGAGRPGAIDPGAIDQGATDLEEACWPRWRLSRPAWPSASCC